MNGSTTLWVIGGVAFAAVVMLFVVLYQALGLGARWHKEHLQETAQRDLADLFVFVDFNRLAYVQFAAYLLVPVAIWVITQNPVFTAAAVPLPFLAPKFVVGFMRKRRLKAFVNQFPDALMMLSASLRAGVSLAVALENLVNETKAPLSQEFALMLRAQRLGASFEDSLKDMEKRLPVQEFLLFSAGLRIARETGGNLAEMLESLADTMYRKLQVEGKIDSLTSQGKIQGLVMAALPLLLMLVLDLMQPQAMHPLFHTMTGWITLAAVAFMEVMGWLGIRRITDIDV
ncbi:MAG: type II secretion system F family protein [Betaproteobacteria bacterium]|nr:type II secretion system F family protein [Betaproteobacteria bacterium]